MDNTELWTGVDIFSILQMANLQIYFACCLLLLTWNSRTSVARPFVTDGTVGTDECVHYAALFKNLLLNVSGLLKKDVLWYGIRSEKILPTSSSDTVLACAPALSKIPKCHMQRNGPFSENECFKNIVRDLSHYETIISSYMKLELRSPDEELPPLNQTLQIIHDLLKSCPSTSTEDQDVKDASHQWENNPFSNRQKMLAMMRAFHIRTITFNRAVSYITSEHMKNNRPL